MIGSNATFKDYHLNPVWDRLNSVMHAISGLEIATDVVANATNILFLATKNSGLVTTVATGFLCYLDLN